jgi:hypothetical protein
MEVINGTIVGCCAAFVPPPSAPGVRTACRGRDCRRPAPCPPHPLARRPPLARGPRGRRRGTIRRAPPPVSAQSPRRPGALGVGGPPRGGAGEGAASRHAAALRLRAPCHLHPAQISTGAGSRAAAHNRSLKGSYPLLPAPARRSPDPCPPPATSAGRPHTRVPPRRRGSPRRCSCGPRRRSAHASSGAHRGRRAPPPGSDPGAARAQAQQRPRGRALQRRR